MFDGASNIQLGENLLKLHCPKLTVMCGVEHTVSLLFNYVSKIPIFNQMNANQKVIYNMLGFGIYHRPHTIFKLKYQEFHNIYIDIFSANDNRMTGYFMGMHREFRMRKVLQYNILYSDFSSMPMN